MTGLIQHLSNQVAGEDRHPRLTTRTMEHPAQDKITPHISKAAACKSELLPISRWPPPSALQRTGHHERHRTKSQTGSEDRRPCP